MAWLYRFETGGARFHVRFVLFLRHPRVLCVKIDMAGQIAALTAVVIAVSAAAAIDRADITAHIRRPIHLPRNFSATFACVTELTAICAVAPARINHVIFSFMFSRYSAGICAVSCDMIASFLRVFKVWMMTSSTRFALSVNYDAAKLLLQAYGYSPGAASAPAFQEPR